MLSRLRRIFEPEIVTWLGPITPICAVIFIGTSIALSPWFSWTNNAISDLGVSDVAFTFNSGLMLTGLLLSVLAISFARMNRESRLSLAGAIVLFVTGVSVVCVGVFTENFMHLHILFSLICFLSLILSSILFGLHFAFNRETRGIGILALSAGPLSIFVWIAIGMPGVAIQETLSAFAAFTWFIPVSMRFRKNRRPRTA
jgi:hypothetical membrane protein